MLLAEAFQAALPVLAMRAVPAPVPSLLMACALLTTWDCRFG